MLEQLLKIVQQNSIEAVVKNKAVPDQYNELVQKEVTNSIVSSLSSFASKGNTVDVVQLFGAAAGGNQSVGLANNHLTKVITDNIVSALGKKFNLSPAVSSGIASILLPKVLDQFSKQVADPKDKSIDMNSVIGSLLGRGKAKSAKPAGGIDFNSILGQVLSGSGGSGGGGIDLGKIAGSILGGGAAKKTPAPKKATTTVRKTTTTGKKVSPAKKSTAKKNPGKDLLGGLLGSVLK